MTATPPTERRFHIATLGCSKNRVDSDGMEHLLRQRGMAPSARPGDAGVVIVNTCGFLGAARAESVGVIEELLAVRQPGQVIIAAGCMPALGNYAHDIPAGVDRVLTTREWFRIGDVVGELLGDPAQAEVAGCEGMLTTFTAAQAGPSAYVKVADGCDHACAFCTIPAIKGRQVSKRPLHVLGEVVDLVSRGTKEIVLVAQDTIRYGADLGIKHGLPQLLESIVEGVPDLPWLRLLYIYPSPLTLKMVDTMARHDALLPYLDMPIQHADKGVLRAMNRPSDIDMTRRLIDHARVTLAEPVMRTTLIVGFPGETEAAFRTLYDFVAEQEFDHVGVFPWSPEPGTKAVELDLPRVPADVAEERRAAIMELQQGISLKKNRALVGRTIEVLIEAVGEAEDDDGNTEPIAVGRARRHAPEVDGMVFVPGTHEVGSLVELEVATAGPYDLWTHAPGAERLPVRPAEARASAGRAARARAKLARRQSTHNRPERRGGQPLPMLRESPAAD
ncbi:MAG: Ribosomal protein S12p Asp88 (E. coli) methylthiotransferase [uncultured Thermomicrobiales bacterium]|uniref:Ribosomal protein uS12 methylthiotransferase RimO n=1 Tax=uncultured Thermomicrobiales bacterium TaxID=1645740 RepID=A0A6J4VFW2_9BACT|nr:MAG: Ribosomal protein S12p Asp88 (E. coli) methylthiotransferase [uncultured Thermomicrobiales bacterium]